MYKELAIEASNCRGGPNGARTESELLAKKLHPSCLNIIRFMASTILCLQFRLVVVWMKLEDIEEQKTIGTSLLAQ